MRTVRRRVAAWAALMCGLIAAPAAANPGPGKPAAHAHAATKTVAPAHNPAPAATPAHAAPAVHHAAKAPAQNLAHNATTNHATTAHNTAVTHPAANAAHHATTTRHAGTAGAGNMHPAVGTLRQAETLLRNANHDYDGYRAKAAAEVAHAIRELGGTSTAQHAGSGFFGRATAAARGNRAAGNGAVAVAKGNGNAVREPQAQSDVQLSRAAQLLAGVHGQIPNGHKAGIHVQNAIGHLNTALKIR